MTVYREKTGDSCFTLCDTVQRKDSGLLFHTVTVYSEKTGGHLFHTVTVYREKTGPGGHRRVF